MNFSGSGSYQTSINSNSGSNTDDDDNDNSIEGGVEQAINLKINVIVNGDDGSHNFTTHSNSGEEMNIVVDTDSAFPSFQVNPSSSNNNAPSSYSAPVASAPAPSYIAPSPAPIIMVTSPAPSFVAPGTQLNRNILA